MTNEFTKLSINAKQSIDNLTQLKYQYKTGQITYDIFKELGKQDIDIFNEYSKALSRSRGIRYKGISLTGFLR